MTVPYVFEVEQLQQKPLDNKNEIPRFEVEKLQQFNIERGPGVTNMPSDE